MGQDRDRLLGVQPGGGEANLNFQTGKGGSKWVLTAALLGAVFVGTVAFVIGRMSLGENEPMHPQSATIVTVEKHAETSAKPTVDVKSDELPPKSIELGNTLHFRVPRECVADGTLEKVYAKLDKTMEAPNLGLSVKLDEFARSLPVAGETKTDNDGARVANAYLRFPERTTWNSLKLSRAKVSIYAPPESDSTYTRSLTFQNTSSQVRAVLNKIGFSVPQSPSYSELHDEACGGAMQIETIPGGASLSCGWGC